MKTDYLKSLVFLIAIPERAKAPINQSQVMDSIGLIVALLVLAYVIYSLLKPEKF
jgi:K+-transporting ATPase KdpF subunit